MAVKASAPNTSVDRRWFLDVDAIGAGAPVIVLLLIGTWRKGGFFKPDIVVLPCLCVVLALTAPSVWTWLRRHRLPVLLGVASTAWWLGEAAIWRHGVESWRLPACWLCAAAGYAIVRGLPPATKTAVASAVTAIGVALSIAGLVLVAVRSSTWTWPDERSLRYQGPLTYPSAIGLYLLLTVLASLQAWPRTATASPRSIRFATITRAIVVLGVVATDSRGALAGLLVMVCFRTVRHELGAAILAAIAGAPVLLYAQRDGVRPLLVLVAVCLTVGIAVLPNSSLHKAIRYLALPALGAAGWLLATQHHAVAGVDASWTERGHILRGAIHLFGAHPLFGAGPDPSIPTTTLTGLPGVDAFAHNEPLEMLLSIGIVGTAFFAITVVYVIRALWARRGALASPVLTTVLAGGLVDFVWHFPALGLLGGVVAAVEMPPHDGDVTS
jgi:O-Antigen ligase